ncbi:MAG: hypothetical protein J0H77_07540 [Alphaproteobacteria bacterium]|nr:hypothetical protein [Alphaproteobacteria bacterium]
MRKLLHLAAGLLALSTLSHALAAEPMGEAVSAAAVTSVTVEGTEFVAHLADGRVLRSADLVGAVLEVNFGAQPARIRIAAVEPDPKDQTGTVWLHSVEVQQADKSWSLYCTPGPDGTRQGFPIEGLHGGPGFSCTSGAVGKCVRVGFRPWAKGVDDQALAPAHAACVRMMRGDYGGDGRGWTRNGMRIDLYDHREIVDDDPDLEASFEAGWSTEGAVCVHHPRVAENVTLAELEERYPHLRGRTGEVCTEAFARSLGALLYNRSRL